MEAKEIAHQERKRFFLKVMKQIGQRNVYTKTQIIKSGYELKVDTWSIKAEDGFEYGIIIMSANNPKYQNSEIECFLSFEGVRTAVESMIELEHLILRNFGLEEEDLDLDSILEG